MNCDDEDLSMYKSIFQEKYDVPDMDGIINLTKYTDFLRLDINNLMVLDVNSYKKVKDFSGRIKSIRVYSNDTHNFLNTKPNHTFYGWYDYQVYNIKERLKLYREIHRVFDVKGNKSFVSSSHHNNRIVINKLGVSYDDICLKEFNIHNVNLFENINHIIYWHIGKDTNNRIVVEAYIHGIPITLHLNGYESDSVKERYDLIQRGCADELFLSDDSIIINDFIKDCLA